MAEADVIRLVQEGLIMTVKISSPVLVLSMAVGLFISILQTTTSIQEQTLTFVPKLIAVFLAVMVFSAYIIHTTVDYTVGVFELIRRF